MATTNKALTTYLPTESVEWLEKYCLDYKHLLNKEGNPKLGTALADIISRLNDGELTLPLKTEPTSTVVGNAQYSTEISTLKGEVEDLKKSLAEYSASKIPDTVLDLEAVNTRIDETIGKAVEPILARLEPLINRVNANDRSIEEIERVVAKLLRRFEDVEPLADLLAELETYTQNQFEAVRDDIEKLTRASTPTLPHKEKPNVDGDTKTWGGFFEMVGIEALTATEAQKKENIDIRTQQIEQGLKAAIDQGLGEWAVKRAGRDFVRVGD